MYRGAILGPPPQPPTIRPKELRPVGGSIAVNRAQDVREKLGYFVYKEEAAHWIWKRAAIQLKRAKDAPLYLSLDAWVAIFDKGNLADVMNWCFYAKYDMPPVLDTLDILPLVPSRLFADLTAIVGVVEVRQSYALRVSLGDGKRRVQVEDPLAFEWSARWGLIVTKAANKSR